MAEDLGVAPRTVELSADAIRLNENDYLKLIRCLNDKQKEFFQHVFHLYQQKKSLFMHS